MAKWWLAVMVVTAGVGTAGWVLAATCTTGELDRNFMIMHTSSWFWENIIGLWNQTRNVHQHLPMTICHSGVFACFITKLYIFFLIHKLETHKTEIYQLLLKFKSPLKEFMQDTVVLLMLMIIIINSFHFIKTTQLFPCLFKFFLPIILQITVYKSCKFNFGNVATMIHKSMFLSLYFKKICENSLNWKFVFHKKSVKTHTQLKVCIS